MAIRKEIQKIERVRTVEICDICGKEASTRECWLCKIDMCSECRNTKATYDPRDWGDYPSLFCNNCWDKGKKAREEIEKLDEKQGDIEDEWYSSCKDKLEESKDYLR